MDIWRLCAAIGLACTLGLPGGALAKDSRLQIIIGGEAYDGPPRFQVTFEGTILGQAAVEAAIDTAKVGRFADAADKTPYVQSFEFAVPEDIFRQDGEVRVRLINEAWGGPGSDRDRNLFLAAVVVNGGAVTVSGLVTATAEGFKPNDLLGEFLVLSDELEEGVSPAPRGGWPMPDAVVAEVTEPRLQPTIDVAKSPAMLPVPGLRQLNPPAASEDEEVEMVAEVSPVSVTDDLATVTTGEGCALDQIYNVVGFNENSNELTPRLTRRLDQIIEDIGNEKCRVQITGYSSTQGDHATNALFAVERAQNVLRYLRANGMQFTKVNATGAGATERFGPDFAANRRVVITVTP
jgi:outer membrane protein OmpA-like peptidoglycan-associated protein